MNCGQLLVLHDALFGVNEGDGLAVLKALSDMCRSALPQHMQHSTHMLHLTNWTANLTNWNVHQSKSCVRHVATPCLLLQASLSVCIMSPMLLHVSEH